MAERYEEKVIRDADGNVIERVEMKPRKRGGGFGWGLLFGLFIIAAAVIVFAYSQGSFQEAGREADHATAQVESTTSETASDAATAAGNFAENAGDAAEQAGDNAKAATQQN